jgi:parvulin-like peptidyl-prolyl isomerase
MKRFLMSLILTMIAGLLAFAQSDLQTVAIVRLTRSEPITVRQFRTEVEKYERQAGRQFSASERREVLNVMINNKLVLQAAERDRVIITDNELNQQIQQLRTQMAQQIGRQPTEDEFAQAIRNEYGMDQPAFRQELRQSLTAQKYLTTKKEALFNSLREPTEAEVVNYYNLNKSQLVRPDTVRFSMIQVPYGADSASRTRARDQADRLIRDIGTSASKFDEAVVRGQVPNAAYQAGDGGYITRSMEAQQIVGVDFLNTAFNLKQGEVSKLIEGNGGYQIIKITETYSQKALELDDILDLSSRMTVRQYITSGLSQEKMNAVLARASQELVTELRTGNPFQIMENNLNW